MTVIGWLQILVFALVGPRGHEAARRLHVPRLRGRRGSRCRASSGRSSACSTALCGVDPKREQTWIEYALALLVFSAFGVLVTYADPAPAGRAAAQPAGASPAVGPELAFNTAASFTTNTNWQSYAGESTMSYLTQMAGLAWHNFTSAAAGIGVALALARGLTRRLGPDGAEDARQLLGRPHPRASLYVLLPICVVDRAGPGRAGRDPEPRAVPSRSTTLEGAKQIARDGPGRLAGGDQEARHQRRRLLQRQQRPSVREPDAAHELRRRCCSIFAIPAALTYTYGRMARDQRQGWALFAAMARAVPGRRRASPTGPRRGGNPVAARARPSTRAPATWRARRSASASPTRRSSRPSPPTPRAARSTRCTTASRRSAASCRWSTSSSARSSSAASARASTACWSSSCSSVFIAGLMVGRTPEYLGKKIEAREMKLAMLYVLIFPLIILGFSGLGARWRRTASRRSTTPGRTALSEILYAFTSGAGNNGSAFAGLNANTPWWNVDARPRDARRPLPDDRPGARRSPARWSARRSCRRGPGTFPTDGPLFAGLLVGVDRHRRRAHLLPGARRSGRSSSTSSPRPERCSEMAAPRTQQLSLFDPAHRSKPAAIDSLRKLAPRHVAKNPVMFVVEVGSVLTTLVLAARPGRRRRGRAALVHRAASRVWLWFTVLFANFAEAVAEGRGKAQADALRKMRKETTARRLVDGREEQVPASQLRKGDVVVVEAGELIPGDGESSRASPRSTSRRSPASPRRSSARAAATARRSPAAPRCSPTASSCASPPNPGESFLDRMIALVEGAARQKTPNEIALHILLVGLTIIFLFACVTLVPLGALLGRRAVGDRDRRAARLPHPDHHRRPALGHRHRRHGPPAAQERARDERPRGRGGGRRRHAAARQDRHHHARQPHGDRAHPGRAASTRRGARRRGAAREPGRRDAGGALDRRAGQGAVRAARPRRAARSARTSSRSARRRA